MERRELLESSALGLGGLGMAGAMVASAPAEAAGESAQTKVASGPADSAGASIQTKAIDTVREWDPAKAELQPKFVELLSIALDASVTHMYAPGTRRHIKSALTLGATHGRDHGDAQDRHVLRARNDHHGDTDPGRGNRCIREEEIVLSPDESLGTCPVGRSASGSRWRGSKRIQGRRSIAVAGRDYTSVIPRLCRARVTRRVLGHRFVGARCSSGSDWRKLGTRREPSRRRVCLLRATSLRPRAGLQRQHDAPATAATEQSVAARRL